MGFNTRDRDFEHWIWKRAQEVRELEREGLALTLIVTGAKWFNDKSFVTNVLDRVHGERGVAEIRYCSAVRTTYYADRWAQSRRVRVRYVRPAEIFRQPAQGVVAFDGPDWFVDKAADAGLRVWRVKPRPLG